MSRVWCGCGAGESGKGEGVFLSLGLDIQWANWTVPLGALPMSLRPKGFVIP